MNNKGALYYIGGEDGAFIRLTSEGLFQAGTYEGAIPHIGEACFKVSVQRQCADYNEAFKLVCQAGGKKFLTDMFSQNPPELPPRPETLKRPKPLCADAQPNPNIPPKREKTSVLQQLREPRQSAPPSKDNDPPARKKERSGPEL